MENRGLIFIPDISGFSRFISETEIEHSRLIVQELLETLINANYTGLEISEIEGDAILFYRFGELPELEALYNQVARMFCAFHARLLAYDARKYCQCAACTTAIALTLKVITHYGEFSGYNVRSFSKLIGKDIIVAHELLKNEIDNHEYWLVTESLLHDRPAGPLTTWMKWNRGEKETRGGPISFLYTMLSQLKYELPLVSVPGDQLAGKHAVTRLFRDFDTDIITLFHASGDFRHRARWREGVRAVEGVDHLLPRVGMRCRLVLDEGETEIYSSSYRYSTDRIEFTENDDANDTVTRYLLETVDPSTTRLTLEYFAGRTPPSGEQQAAMERSLENSLDRLATLVKEIQVPDHTAH